MSERPSQEFEAELVRLRSENRRLHSENEELRDKLGSPARKAPSEPDSSSRTPGVTVIIPFLSVAKNRCHAAFNIIFGGKPPLALLGRS